MSSTAIRSEEVRTQSALNLGAGLMTFAAVAFMGYAALFLVINFASESLELGIGTDQVNVTKDEIKAFSPSLDDYLSHAHVALAGFIASTGLATAALSWFGIRSGMGWAWVAAVVTPVLALAIALPLHYPYGFDTIGHLGLIYLATAIFVAGAVISGRALREARS